MEFTALTYNIRHGRWPGSFWQSNLDTVAATIAELDASIVGLQEVDRRRARTGFVDLAGRLAAQLGMHLVFGPAMGGQYSGYGNALLSRWPLGEVLQRPLPGVGEPRQAIQAKVLLPTGKPLTVWVTHLGLLATTRVRQVEQLAEWVSSVQGPRLLMGDLNALPRGPELKPLRVAGLRDAFARAGTGLRHTYMVGLPTVRIDYQFVSPELKVLKAWVPRRPGSDHYPLAARLSCSPS